MGRTVAELMSGNISNAITNVKTWGDLIFNVKAYGAKGDGVTDDTSPIQMAINAASQAGGGKVDFPPGEYVVSSTLNAPDNVIIEPSGHAVILFTGSGVCFRIVGDNVSVRYMEILGPYTADVYSANSRAIEGIGTTSDNLDNIQILGNTIKYFGDSALWFEHIQNSNFMSNVIERIGRSGIIALSATNCHAHYNKIKNIQPGFGGISPRLNAYGIAFSRDISKPVLVSPSSKHCSIAFNIIDNIPTWEGIDTHGGDYIDVLFNRVTNCATAINVTHADGADEDNANYIRIIGNYLEVGSSIANTRASAITFTPKSSSPSLGVGLVISQNFIVNGGMDWDNGAQTYGALRITNSIECVISDNVFIDSYGKAIELEGQIINMIIRGNSFLNVNTVGTDNTILAVDTGTIQVLFEGNSIYRTAGNMDVFSFSTPSSGYGVKIGDNQYFGTMNLFKGVAKQNVQGGSFVTEAKAWAKINTNGTVAASFNVQSVTKNGTGDYTITWKTPFADGNYVVLATSSAPVNAVAAPLAAENARVVVQNTSGSALDPNHLFIVAFGL